MQTIEQLENMGIDKVNAQRMLDFYGKRIGWVNGDYKVTDITYMGNNTRDVELTCIKCGRTYHKDFVNGRNKWSEMKSICPCESEKRHELELQAKLERQQLLKNFQEEKRLNILSLVGTTHGDLIVLSVDNEDNPKKYNVKCSRCGAISQRRVERFKDSKGICGIEGCGSPIKYDESYIGQKNNFLTVIGITRLQNKHRAFACICDCGEITVIEPTMWEKGYVKSCGCKQKELLSVALKKDSPVTKERLYGVYTGMKQRCYNPKCDNYHNYGGRGITLCDEWLGENGYKTFSEWAYSNGYDDTVPKGVCTIERKDVNGIYSPGNCCFISIAEQQKNKRNNLYLTINGKKQIMADWQRETGLSPYSLKKLASGETKNKQKEKSTTLKVRISVTLLKRLREYADTHNKTVSDVVRNAIEREIKQ